MNAKIEKSWKSKLKTTLSSNLFNSLTEFVNSEYQSQDIYPQEKDVFKAFDLSPFDQTKVVIIGQDPYHDEGQAHGLCFSVMADTKMPPSLKNIFKEIKNDLNIPIPAHGNLERWAKQGVLLLNATLTVRAHQAGSHQKKGWEEFTDEVIRVLSDNRENIAFILWGAYAQKKGLLIDGKKHHILESPHPSPFAAYKGFFGNKHFSQTNAFLKSKGLTEIEW